MKRYLVLLALLIYGVLSPLVSQAQTPTPTLVDCDLSETFTYAGDDTYIYAYTNNAPDDIMITRGSFPFYTEETTQGIIQDFIITVEGIVINIVPVYLIAGYPQVHWFNYLYVVIPAGQTVDLMVKISSDVEMFSGSVPVCAVPFATNTATPMPTPTNTSTATNTPAPLLPSSTATRQAEPSPTPTNTPEPTSTATNTPAPTLTPRATATPQPWGYLLPNHFSYTTLIYLPLVIK
jgi:hypothetical protein